MLNTPAITHVFYPIRVRMSMLWRINSLRGFKYTTIKRKVLLQSIRRRRNHGLINNKLRCLRKKYNESKCDYTRRKNRNKYTNAVRAAKKSYLRSRASELKRRDGVFKLINKKESRGHDSTISSIQIDGNISKDPQEIANHFKLTFTDKIERLSRDPNPGSIMDCLRSKFGVPEK